ncbi:MAG TPA: sugar phosphate nucleotidyltransferase [Fimbriimonadaceae bacterium]|nr:sugar phosphate nucleotidyltransferase [Fimbriimonadaceae bacterium]
MKRIAAIMAGGYGERFWPLSRRDRPKQLLPLTNSGRTLLQDTIHRVEALVPPEHVYVATTAALANHVAEATPEVPAERIFSEPAKRNTAGCLAWVVAVLQSRLGDEDAVLAVLPSDHYIRKQEAFERTLKLAFDQAEEAGLVTIGVRPTRPETGFGYIQIGGGEGAVHEVAAFHEKPNSVRALEYLDSGQFLWNSGMFFWKLSVFHQQLQQVDPAYDETIEKMTDLLRHGSMEEARAAFETLPDISIDYLLMEKAEQVYVVEAEFEWDDLGTLASLEAVLPIDPNGNASRGSTLLVDAANCLVVNENPGIRVCALGVEDLVIVATGDTILVLPKDRCQDVRMVAQEAERAP